VCFSYHLYSFRKTVASYEEITKHQKKSRNVFVLRHTIFIFAVDIISIIMKKALVFCLTCFAAQMFFQCTPQSGSSADSEEILYSSHKPYTRWWWFAAEIDTADVKYQLDWLKENNFGGVEIAWIYPMFGDSAVQRPAWLSGDWAAPVNFAKRYADLIGLGCDYTYGTLWPFNDLNMPDEDGSKSYFDTVSPMNRNLIWDHPKRARILNHLDKEAFYRYAGRMNKGMGQAYEGSRSGVFVDSWEVETRYLWTKGFGEKFRNVSGYEIEPLMKTLYDKGNEDIFYDYMKVLSDYVLYEFYEPFTINANRVGAFSRAQCGGAPADLLTAFSLVDIPETEAILYEPNFSRIPASAAALTSKQAVTSETFTCIYSWTGWGSGRGKSPYQKKEQTGDMKLIADALFANGTNQIIWHGMPYNKKGDTTNFFYTTVHVGPDSYFSGQLKEFNGYMEKVSGYMRKGKTYSDVAVYMPLEDSWMQVDYPDSLKMPWVWGAYELRYIFAPEQLKGRQPLWVNHHFLSAAKYENSRLYCGDITFSSLCLNVDYLDIEALRNIVRLAGEGLPVWFVKTPAQPGKNKSPEYAELITKLSLIPNVSANPEIIRGKALIEGENLPDFWCRDEGGELYIFFANPMSQNLKYPLTYLQSFDDKGSQRNITINANGKTEKILLDFKPSESLLIKINKDGVINFIDLGFKPEKII